MSKIQLNNREVVHVPKKNIMLILTLILSAVILTSIASSIGDDAKVAIIVPHPDDETRNGRDNSDAHGTRQ